MKFSWIRCVCFLLIISVTGCVSQESRLESGIQSFQRQDFYQAFQRLKNIAREGNPEAQYAIGYMYYYGQGVLEDKQEAIFWTTKAAKQNYPLAIEALKLMVEGR